MKGRAFKIIMQPHFIRKNLSTTAKYQPPFVFSMFKNIGVFPVGGELASPSGATSAPPTTVRQQDAFVLLLQDIIKECIGGTGPPGRFDRFANNNVQSHIQQT